MTLTNVATLSEALTAIRAYRYLAGTESELQGMLAQVLEREGVPFLREFDLGTAGTIDFYLPLWRTGVELKTAGSPAAVLRQLYRYAAAPEIDGLVLLTNHARLGGLPATISDKPLQIVSLWEHAL